MRARPHDLALPLQSPHPQTRSHPEVPGVRMPAYLCSGDATQPMTLVRSPSILTGSLRPPAVEGRRKRSQNTRFLTPSSGTCDGHTLWATWRRGPLGKRGTVSPRADALRTPSGPAGKRSSSPTRQPVLGPPRRPAGDAAGTRFLLAVSSHSQSRLYLSQQSRSPVTPARGPGSPSVTRRTTFEAFGKMANSLAAYPLSGTLSPQTPKSCLLHGPPCSGRLQ